MDEAAAGGRRTPAMADQEPSPADQLGRCKFDNLGLKNFYPDLNQAGDYIGLGLHPAMTWVDGSSGSEMQRLDLRTSLLGLLNGMAGMVEDGNYSRLPSRELTSDLFDTWRQSPTFTKINSLVVYYLKAEAARPSKGLRPLTPIEIKNGMLVLARQVSRADEEWALSRWTFPQHFVEELPELATEGNRKACSKFVNKAVTNQCFPGWEEDSRRAWGIGYESQPGYMSIGTPEDEVLIALAAHVKHFVRNGEFKSSFEWGLYVRMRNRQELHEHIDNQQQAVADRQLLADRQRALIDRQRAHAAQQQAFPDQQ